MRIFWSFLFCLSFALAEQEVIAPHVRVLFDDPKLEDYAEAVAEEAEKALMVLQDYFVLPEKPIVITINNNTDIYNGFASPLPRPKVSIRALFPNTAGLTFGARSELFFLLIHELTHVQQLSYNEGSSGLPALGLVGENTARVPPMWFLEGIAVWIESEHTEAGRRDDALTRGLLHTLALSDQFPTLDEISLDTFASWPGGNARYVLGGSFLDYLIDHHGFETILATLRDFNAGLFDGFNSSWLRVTGRSLFDEWEDWSNQLKQEASLFQDQTTLLTETSSFTSSPVFSPNGKQLAWVSMPSKIVVADFDGKELVNLRTIIDRRFPESLDWLDDSTLIYSRIVRQPGTEFLELFSLDIQTGRETQLTQGARAQMPRAMPDGCILFVRDLPQEGSNLRKYCAGTLSDYWASPQGSHIVGLDVSAEGKVALSLWQAGHVDIVVLENQELRFLTQDRFQDLQPTWHGESQIVFSSDQSGKFELYRIMVNQQDKDQVILTQSLGGAFQMSSNGDVIIYTALGAEGYDLALQDREPVIVQKEDKVLESSESDIEPKQDFQIRPFSSDASMKPYGWLPSVGVSLSPLGANVGASILSLDDSLQHSLAVNVAYDTTLDGHLFGATVVGNYAYHDNTVYTTLLPPYPLGFGVQLGVWEHTGHLRSLRETALGLQGFVQATLPLDRWVARGRLEVGLLHLRSFDAFQPDVRLEASMSQLSTDDWSYRTRGQRFGVTGVLSATDQGGSMGLWAEGSYYRFVSLPPVSGTLELALRAGYRQSPAVGLTLEDWAAVGVLGYRYSIPVEWRIDDGVYSFERFTLEPRLRPYFDGSFGLATDLTLNADLVLGYGAPLSVGLSFGYAEGFWYGLAWRLAL